MLKAVRFFHEKVARQGGYLWEDSGDLTLREAEDLVEDGRVWCSRDGRRPEKGGRLSRADPPTCAPTACFIGFFD